MKRIIDWITDHPWLVIAVLVAATLFFGYQMKNLKVNPDITEALPKTIPAKRLYDKMNEIFPSKDFIMVVVVTDDIFTTRSIALLDKLTKKIEEFPEVYDVISPTNVKVIEASEEGLDVRPALEKLPESSEEIEQFRKRLYSNPIFIKNLISSDQKAAAVMVLIRKNVDSDAFAEKLIGFLDEFQKKEKVKILPAGTPVVNYYISIGIARDMNVFFTSGIVLMFLLLLFIFRSARGVFIPLTVVLSSVIWTLGFMALTGRPLSHATEMLPILLMAIGIADSVHILTHYYQKARTIKEAKPLVRTTMHELYSPVIMTSLTTMVGFLALNTSNMESLMELGVFSAFGVFIALIWSLSFVPAVLVLLKVKVKGKWREEKAPLQAPMASYSKLLINQRRTVAAAIMAVILISILAVTRLYVESSSVSEFPEDHPVRQAAEYVNAHFAGTTTFQVIVEGDRAGYIKEPKVLKKMDELERYAETLPHVGSAQSIADFIKLMNKVLHGGKEEYYRVPEEIEVEEGVVYDEETGEEVKTTFRVEGRQLVAQYLQLYEMSSSPDDFANFVDFDYKNAKITIFLNTDRDSVLRKVDAALSRFIKEKFRGIKADITGMAKLLLEVRKMVIRGQFLSILASLALVWFLTTLMFRSPVLGVFNTIPLFFGIFLNFAVMGLLRIPLNIQTMVTSSLAIGIGVDYAIHFIHRYLIEMKGEPAYSEAVLPAMQKAGVAIVFNSLIVASGFALLMLSAFTGVREMGFLLALTMLTTAFGALTILPIVFVTLKPKALLKASKKKQEEIK